jgi:hypothetical protein
MARTKTTLVAIGVIAAGAAGFIVLRGTRPKPPPSPPPLQPSSEHGAGIDNAMAAYRALFYAPVGKTPCESAYNAFKASDDVANAQMVKPIVLRLAPRDEFLAKCEELPPATQQCIVPLYLSQHRDACQSAKVSPEVLKPMVETQPAAVPPEPHDPAPANLPPPPH